MVGGGGGDLCHEITAGHGRGGLRAGYGLLCAQLGGEAGALGPLGAQQLGELAGVDALNAGDVVARQPVLQRLLGAPVGVQPGQLCHGKAAYLRAGTLVVFLTHAVIADERVSHGNNLATVGGIRQNLLVSGHGGVEASLAGDGAGAAEGGAFKNRSVFQC